MSITADVLLVTATETESRAVFQIFAQKSLKPKPLPIGKRIYHDFGEINGARVVLTQCEMGSGGPGGSQQAVADSLRDVKPAHVIMVGIAFGVDEEKQKIGDVLVSQQLKHYDPERLGATETISRGDKPHASTQLIDLFRSAKLYWEDENVEVRFGLVLSGAKLVDNKDFRNRLLEFEPEAIGGDMEAIGMYTACHNNNTDWILVKAICDWGDNKGQDKKTRQKLAAKNAARFVLHTLETISLKPQEPRTSPFDLAPIAVPRAAEPVHSTLPRQTYFFGREDKRKEIAAALDPAFRGWGVLIDGPGGIGKTALAIKAADEADTKLFAYKLFLSAKNRQLTVRGEKQLYDYLMPNYLALISELGRALGNTNMDGIREDQRVRTVTDMLAGQRVLIVIDNVETFDTKERDRLFEFLDRLPEGNKAIVTSRRRDDTSARVIRLARMTDIEGLALLTELSYKNEKLIPISEADRRHLGDIAGWNPLLLTWLAGQLGRTESRCRTVTDAEAYLKSAPHGNDPLEYIFGDLVETFTTNETVVLASLTHFTEPAEVEWITNMSNLTQSNTEYALESLADRALLERDDEQTHYLLPALAASFLRRKHPEIVQKTGDRLEKTAYALAMLYGGSNNYNGHANLTEHWLQIVGAWPLFVSGKFLRLQRMYSALVQFLDFSGRWDIFLEWSIQVENKAIAEKQFVRAGWAAYHSSTIYLRRKDITKTLASTEQCKKFWNIAKVTGVENAILLRIEGQCYYLNKNWQAAENAFSKALEAYQLFDSETMTEKANHGMALVLNDIGLARYHQKSYNSSSDSYHEALEIAYNIKNKELIAIIKGNLALLSLVHKDWISVRSLSIESLSLSEEVGRQELIGANCVRLAKAMCNLGDAQLGLDYVRRGIDIYRKLQSPHISWAKNVLQECEMAITVSSSSSKA